MAQYQITLNDAILMAHGRAWNTGRVCNAAQVKKSKELDDSASTKNDIKDALTITRLVKDGHLVEPVFPEDVFAKRRSAMNQRERPLDDLHRTAGEIHNWLDRCFLELVQRVFQRWDGMAVLATLRAGRLSISHQ